MINKDVSYGKIKEVHKINFDFIKSTQMLEIPTPYHK